ncbi:MAG: zinc ribbon domain-containing protein [Oscillospiraceae bacterium]|nr:zinc ribbon domain-containing protein [Oscillospiraceae bacterium]MBR6678457.1 zinc ribbon domain-containing protein [Oscillospiraceae bacterium]
MPLDFLSNLSEKAKEVAYTAGEKAKAAAETAKVNVQIMNEQRSIDKSYKAIGEWFVAEFQGEIPAEVKDLVDSINAAKLRIAELQAQPEEEVEVEIIVEEEPAKKYCAGCGEEVTGKFCSNCGAAQE